MKEVLSSGKSLQTIGLKEYVNTFFLILFESKAYKLLSAEAKHCPELLYKLSKLNAKKNINIIIDELESILPDSKNYHTLQNDREV